MTQIRSIRLAVLCFGFQLLACGDGGGGEADLSAGGPDLAAVTDLAGADIQSDDLSEPDLAPAPVVQPWPGFDGEVRAILHAGNAWYLGGQFTRASTVQVSGLVAADATGATAHCDLGTGFDARVRTVLQVGNALYVGGEFTRYQGASARYLAKLDATTCALDTTFNSPAGNGFDSYVSSLATAGTSLYAGGAFTAYRGLTGSANRLAKLDLASGAIDTTFSPATNGFNGNVFALAVNGTSLYVGGSFNAYRGVADSANRLAKLDLATGAIDLTLSPIGASSNGFDGAVYALAVTDTALYAGGVFTAYKSVAGSASRLAKLSPTTGALDLAFSPSGVNGFDAEVDALHLAGGALYAGGIFTAYRNVADSAFALAKLDATSGALDTTFSPPGFGQNGLDGNVRALTTFGGALYVGGQFARYKNVARSAPNVVKLDPTSGAIDTTWKRSGDSASGVSDGNVMTLAGAGGRLWIGGNFALYGGHWVNALVKLDDVTHAIDATFSPPAQNGFTTASSIVYALASAGTSLYVGGDFRDYRGGEDNAMRLAKLDLATGAIDAAFSPPGALLNGFDAYVNALTVAGTSLYVGGAMSAYRGVADSTRGIAKLDLGTGAADTTFSPPGFGNNGFDDQVYALVASAGSLYVGGQFTGYRGVPASANYLARLDLTTGARDATFGPVGVGMNGFDNAVQALSLAGGALYVGGHFNQYQNVLGSAVKLARVDATTGALDTTFSPNGVSANGFDQDVRALLAVGTVVYAGGGFAEYRAVAVSAARLAKLDQASGALDTTFSPPGAGANGLDYQVHAIAAAPIAGVPVMLVGGGFSRYRGTNLRHGLVAVDPATGALR